MGLLKKLLPIAGAVVGNALLPGVGGAIGGALGGAVAGKGGAGAAAGGLLAAGLTKEQAQKSIEDYNQAQSGAITAQTGARDASLGYYQPYATGGQQGFTNALNMQSGGFQYSPSDPSYAWRLGEGTRAIDRSAASRGSLFSGGTLKDLTRFGQGLASTEFGADFNRNNQLAQFGMDAARGQANTQSGYANGITNALFAGARGRDPARIAKGQAASDQVGAGVDLLGSIFGGGGAFGGAGSTGLNGFMNSDGFNEIASAFGF